MASTARIEELRKKYEENQRRYFAPLANEYRKAGQLEEAIALCRAWLPQQPGHMSGHIVFGQTLYEAGELSEAQSVFETALELDPENLIALRHLGDIARQHGEADSARSWYRRVLDADPRNDEISSLLAQLDSMPAHAGSGASESAMLDAAVSDEVMADVEAPVVEVSFEATVQPDTAETAAWGSTPDETSEAQGGASDEAAALFDTAGTVAFQDDASPLDDAYRQLALDAAASMAMDAPPGESVDEPSSSDSRLATNAASAGDTEARESEEPKATSSAAADMGLEVMEFVPPPRDTTRVARSEPSPFDGHLLTDDADASSATPAAFVTETMAELYLQQGFRDEALGVYKQLLQQNPDDEALRDRVSQLESGSKSSVGMAAISDQVIESAQRRQVAHTPPSMRAFLAKLAVRRAPRREAERSDESIGESDDTGPQGALPESGEPGPDAGGAGAELQQADWQLPPDEGAPEIEDAGPYAESAGDQDAAADSDADTAEWIADDDSRLSAAAEEPSGPAAPAPGTPGSNGTVNRPSAPTPRTVGAVGSLFAGAVVQAGDDAAASALAAAFAPEVEKPRDGMVGRPTRAAKSEISLDHVFRESGSRPAASRERSSFSFDQFFSENASGGSAGNDSPGAPDDDAPGDDIEQFNSWLEGLKKK